MKKLYCYILILIISVFLLSGCSNEQTKGWTDNDLYGTFETTHFTTQELDLTDFNKKFVKILNATIIDITYNLQTSNAIIQVYNCGEEVNNYLPHFHAVLYTDIPYYKQQYEIEDVVSFEGFIFYTEISEQNRFIDFPFGTYYAAYRFDISPAIIINN